MDVLIIEDEHLAAQKLTRQLKKIDPTIEVSEVLDDVESAVDWLQVNSPDLILCDIHLGDGNSFSIFQEVEVKTPIIFTTAYDQYAVKAFKLNSIDYLLKPIAQDELTHAIEKFKDSQLSNQLLDFDAIVDAIKPNESSNYQKRFMVYVGDHIRTVNTGDIAYAYAEGKYVFIVTHENKEYNIDYTLDRLTSCLNPEHFFRVNRQFVVSLDGISDMYAWSKSRVKLVMNPKPTSEVIVSRERTSDFKKWLNQ
jgi:DNA-binding LytR/AlgR family response regulator